MSASPARLSALWEIDQRTLPGWPARSMRRLRRYRLSDARDVDLAEKITHGVIKELLVLQRLATEYSGRSLQQIDVPTQKILAMAMYQMRSLARVPTHAIVDDAVEQTRDGGLGGAGGFVNAVLRKAAGDRAAGETSHDTADLPARAEREASVPREVFHRFAALYGGERALELCIGFNREPPILARLIGATTIDALLAIGVEATPHDQPGIVILTNIRRARLRELANSNLCQPQDATSAATVCHLDLQEGQRALDRCCGRGTKTRQIVERVGPTGEVVAMDSSAERIATLRETLDAHAMTNVQAVNAGTINGLGEHAAFDRVLIDAPCSNSGVFARRPEARYHQSRQHVSRIVELQKRILIDTAPVVALGGLMAYATCSVWPEENEALVDAFVKRDGRFERISQTLHAPNPDTVLARYRDGGYVAVLRRT